MTSMTDLIFLGATDRSDPLIRKYLGCLNVTLSFWSVCLDSIEKPTINRDLTRLCFQQNQSSALLLAYYSVAMIIKNWTSDLFVCLFLGNILLPCFRKKDTKLPFCLKIQLANYQSMKQFAFCGFGKTITFFLRELYVFFHCL